MANLTADQCNVPPHGWLCTRAPGHEGPCAAVPVSNRDGLPEITEADVKAMQAVIDTLYANKKEAKSSKEELYRAALDEIAGTSIFHVRGGKFCCIYCGQAEHIDVCPVQMARTVLASPAVDPPPVSNLESILRTCDPHDTDAVIKALNAAAAEIKRLRDIINPGDAAAYEEGMAAKEAQIEQLQFEVTQYRDRSAALVALHYGASRETPEPCPFEGTSLGPCPHHSKTMAECQIPDHQSTYEKYLSAPCPWCEIERLTSELIDATALAQGYRNELDERPAVETFDVREENRKLCAKDGHVLGVIARPCLRCHEWFDPQFGPALKATRCLVEPVGGNVGDYPLCDKFPDCPCGGPQPEKTNAPPDWIDEWAKRGQRPASKTAGSEPGVSCPGEYCPADEELERPAPPRTAPRGKPCTCDNCLGSSCACRVDAGEKLGELWYCRKRAKLSEGESL